VTAGVSEGQDEEVGQGDERQFQASPRLPENDYAQQRTASPNVFQQQQQAGDNGFIYPSPPTQQQHIVSSLPPTQQQPSLPTQPPQFYHTQPLPPRPTSQQTPIPTQHFQSMQISSQQREIDPVAIASAQKMCKYAISALDYEDIRTAIDHLNQALALIKPFEGISRK
jgi:vacuolar protein sorting-associated protein VTA1